MASFEKRASTWRARISLKGFPRESATFDTKAEAIAWAGGRETELRGAKRGKVIPRTVIQALDEYAKRVAPTHKGARWEKIRCAKFKRTLPFKAKLLEDVRTSDLADWRDTALTELAPGSVRREMGLLHQVFEAARLEWGWLHENPLEDVRRPRKPAARTRLFTDDEIERILLALGYERGNVAQTTTQRVAVALLLALETAMRAGELCSITPASINAKGRFLTLPKTKNGDARDVPLSKAALALLELVPKGLELTPATVDVLFRRARDRAEIKGVHFHDSRANAITRLSKKLDVLELARMIGHRDLNSLQAYYRITPAEIAARLD